MRKYLSTGLFGTILGLAVGAPANAALVSRGFLDEALENYATTTALDLKANQSDFTDLNTEISGSVDVLRQLLEQTSNSYEFVKGINPEKFPNTISGAFVLLHQYLNEFARSILHGWTDSNGTSYAGFDDLNNGWTDSKNKTYLGVKGLNDKIGTLPTEIVIGNSNGPIDMFNITKLQRVSLPKDYTLSDFIQDMYYGSFGGNVGLGSSPFYGLSDIINHVMYGGIIGEVNPDLTGKQYKGLIDLTREINKIGDLPTPDTTVAGMMGNPVLLGKEQTIIPLYDLILWGSNGQMVINPITGMPMPFPLLGLHDITHKVNKIGDLPTEYETVGAALTAIKGIAEDAKAAALAAIPDPKAEGSTGKFVLTVDIVGDNATYRWEKIDRESETTTTTNE